VTFTSGAYRGDAAEEDFDNARAVTITHAVELPATQPGFVDSDEGPYDVGLGHLLYNAGLDPLPIPAEFTDSEVGPT
jgi:hypothetical protein